MFWETCEERTCCVSALAEYMTHCAHAAAAAVKGIAAAEVASGLQHPRLAVPDQVKIA